MFWLGLFQGNKRILFLAGGLLLEQNTDS